MVENDWNFWKVGKTIRDLPIDQKNATIVKMLLRAANIWKCFFKACTLSGQRAKFHGRSIFQYWVKQSHKEYRANMRNFGENFYVTWEEQSLPLV